jgi:hypothetical protein
VGILVVLRRAGDIATNTDALCTARGLVNPLMKLRDLS